MNSPQPVFQQIPAAVFVEGAAKLRELDAIFAPFFTPLDDKQRKQMLKASNKTASFITKGGEYSQSNPQFLPSYYTPDQVAALVRSNESLRNFFQSLAVFTGNINDTAMVSSGATFAMLLKYYNSVKDGARLNLPDAKTIYKDLSARFPGRPKKKEPVTDVKPATKKMVKTEGKAA